MDDRFGNDRVRESCVDATGEAAKSGSSEMAGTVCFRITACRYHNRHVKFSSRNPFRSCRLHFVRTTKVLCLSFCHRLHATVSQIHTGPQG